jgi:lysophospholipase L1-like esterase
LTPNIIAVSNTSNHSVVEQQRAASAAALVPYYEIDVTGLMPDRIHFNADGYRQWVPAIMGAVEKACTVPHDPK